MVAPAMSTDPDDPIHAPLADGFHEVPAGKVAAIETALEMLARPPDRAEAPNQGWSVRRVAHPDTAWYRELFRRVGEDWLWFSRLRLSEARLAALISAPGIEVYALSFEGSDEGLLELDFRVAGECELAFFGLTRRLIGTGAGRHLMNRAIAEAWSRPIRRFWVHTCTFDHPGAVAFYTRSGFRAFRRRVEISEDPRLDGTCPAGTAPHAPVIGPAAARGAGG